MVEPNEDAIAVVGIGCKVPGAENIRDFWRLLLKGENHVVEIPASRWNANASYDPDPMAPGKCYVKRAGLVSGWDEFDNKLYGINDFEAPQMDPQQRFVLDCAFMALQDAGLTRAQIAGSSTGVFVGAMNADYRGLFTAQSSNIGNYTVTGISNSIIAARLSYVFDLRGPSLVLDTACSSSLIAIHLGCQAILTGDCDMAICGGVNYLTLPDVFVHLSKARMISPSGQCHSFSINADGYTRGEGCGIVIIKRLRDAERDGDNIWATIYTGSNQDGHAVSPITAPSGLQQIRLMDHVYRKTGMDISAVDYIEAHGTGTGAGDPVEVNSLGEYFQQHASSRRRYIGSVKTNIGHLESAAGVVGIIKVLLMMKHGKIVPSLHFDQPNPKIRFQEFQLTVPTSPVEWVSPDKVSCCNSFGFGGSNSHAVIKHYRKPEGVKATIATESQTPSLQQFCDDASVSELSVHDVSYTSTVRRDHFPLRLAYVVNDMQELLNALRGELARFEDPVPLLHKPKVTFVFGGMGTSWAGMCMELLHEVPVFRKTIQEVDKCLSVYVPWSLTDRLRQGTYFDDAEFSPIAIFACQVALAATWRALGVEPERIVGQSVGEVAAAHVAGCLEMADAVKVVYHRTHLLAQVTGGKMAVARQVSVEQVRRVVARYPGRACLSLEYSPTACCISADAEVMEEVKAELLREVRAQNKSVQFVDLTVSVAYHSHHVQPCQQPLADALQGIEPRPPRVPFSSSVTGELLTTAPDVTYWVDNLRMPVLFDRAVRKSRDPRAKAVFLEIGPKPTLRAHLPDIFDKEDVAAVASMGKQPEYKFFLQAVVELHLLGVDLTWAKLPTLGTRITDIPRYVFDPKKNLARSESAAVLLGGVDDSRRCHAYTLPIHNSLDFKLLLSPIITKTVYDHVISGKIVVPGAVYAEAAFAIGRQMTGWEWHPVAVAVDFEAAMSVAKDTFLELDVHVTDSSDTEASFKVVKENRLLARLHLTKLAASTSPGEHVTVQHVQSRCPSRVTKDAIYAALRSSGFQYGDSFSLLEYAWKNSTECLAALKVCKQVTHETVGCTIHPCILDCTLQSCLIITLEEGQRQELLPKSIDRLVVHGAMETAMFVHTTLRFRGSRQSIYDLKLLSTSGHVIAELDGLVISFITENRQGSLQDMFVMEWSPLVPLPPPDGEANHLRHVILTDQDVGTLTEDSQQTVTSYAGHNFLNGLTADVQRAVTSSKDAAAVVLLRLRPFHADSTGDEVNFDIMNECFLYKGVLSLASQLALSIPIYLCTCRAWPARGDMPVNPACTALWGLVRSVVRERIYPNVVAVDFQLSPDKLTPSFLRRALHVMTTDSTLRNYPEVMIDQSSVAVNHVIRVDPDTAVPLYRHTSSDDNKAAILLSREANALSEPMAVLYDVTATDGRVQREITVACHTFAIHSSNLLHMKMRYERLGQTNSHNSKGFAVFALEVVGQADLTSTKSSQVLERVAACYPLMVATHARVPASCLLPIRLLPGYRLGDVTRLLMLYELQAQVQTSPVTILSTTRTSFFARIIENIVHRRKTGKPSGKISIVQLDQMTDPNVTFEETVLSLAMLDGATMANLATRWRGGRSLVVCSALMDAEALSCAYCLLPEVDVRVVDTRMLFKPANLRKLTSELAKWVKSQGADISRVMDALHPSQETEAECIEGEKPKSVSDVMDLLTFRKWEMGQTEFKADQQELFRKDSFYLVVGGLTGLGWICVEYLAEKGAGHVAIVNRRSPTPHQLAAMSSASSTFKCQIRAFQADVTLYESISRALQEMESAFPGAQLKGVFFGAAVTADRSFLAMDVASFDMAMSPKVRGVWNLHLLTRGLALDYFVMHSSVASVVGNSGQANYAAGNGFLDGLAHFRRQQGLAGQAVNWGALDVGLVDASRSARRALEAQGFMFLTSDEIRDILTPVLMLNWPQCSPSKFDLEKLTQRLIRDGLAPLRARLEKIMKRSGEETAISEDMLFEVQQAKTMEREKRLLVFENYIRFLAARALSVDVKAVISDVSLVNLGMDSIVAMTMINQIRRDTSRRLPAVALVTGETTVVSLALALDEAADEGGEQVAGETDPQAAPGFKDSNLRDASLIESYFLQNYRLNSIPSVFFHGTVDILLKQEVEPERVQAVLSSVAASHPACRAGFRQTARATFSLMLHARDMTPDLRVISADSGSGELMESITQEFFDLKNVSLARFILLQGARPARPLLRIVYHKAAFDYHTAGQLARDLSVYLGSPEDGRPRTTAALLPGSSAVNTELSRLLPHTKDPAVQFWQPILSRTPGSVSLKPWSAEGRTRAGEVSSVAVSVPQGLANRLREFISLHRLFVLGVVASCHQLALHALTGSSAVPLLFPLDLRLVFTTATSDNSSCCNDVPLIAFIDDEKMGSGNCSLMKFVLDNTQAIEGCLTHGLVPLGLLQPVAGRALSHLDSCTHGISISKVNCSRDVANGVTHRMPTQPASADKPCKKQNGDMISGFRILEADELVCLSGNLETTLNIAHDISRGRMQLTLAYRTSAVGGRTARLLLHLLTTVIALLLQDPGVSVRKLARRLGKARGALDPVPPATASGRAQHA